MIEYFTGWVFEQEREDPSLTEWDRFAHMEYIRLSTEEDGEDASIGSAEVWDEPYEAPFWDGLVPSLYDSSKNAFGSGVVDKPC